MAEANLIIGVETVGTQEAEAQLNTLTNAENQVTASTDRMSKSTAAYVFQARMANQRQKVLSQTSSAAATAFANLAGGASQAAGSQDRAAEATTRFGISLPKVTAESQKAGRGMAMIFNEGTEMLFMLGSAVPQMRLFATHMAGAGNSAFALANVVGRFAVPVAAVIAILPTLIGLLNDTEEEMDETADATRDATNELREFVRAAAEARQAEARSARILSGGGTAEELREMADGMALNVERAQARLEQAARAVGADPAAMQPLVAQAQSILESGGHLSEFVRQTTGHLGGAERANQALQSAIMNRLNAERSAAQFTRQAAEAEAEVRRQAAEDVEVELLERQEQFREPSARQSSRGGGSRAADQAATAERERLAAELESLSAISQMQNDLRAKRERFQDAEAARLVEAKELEIEIQDAIITKLEEREEREKALAAAAQERYAEQQDQLRQLGADFGDAFEGGVDRTIAAFERLNLALGKAGEDTIDTTDLMVQATKAAYADMASGTAAGATEAFSAAVQAAVSGEQSFADAIKAQTHEFIRGIVLRSTVAAVEQGAAALAAAAIGNFPAAAAHGAAAAQYAAVAGVAASVGAAAGSFAPKKKKPEEPKEPQKNRERKEQQTLVINVGTFPVSTDADVGRAVQQALQAVERRDGR